MKAFAKALALFGAGSAVGTLTQVVKGKLGALFLGPEGVGVLSQLTNVWSLLFTVSGLGFYNGIVHDVAAADAREDLDTIRTQFTSSLIVLTAFSVACTFASVAAAGYISNAVFADRGHRAWLISLVLISVPFSIVAQIYTGIFSGLRLIRQVVSVQAASDLLSVPFFAALTYRGDLWGAAIAFSLTNVVKLGIQIFVARRHLPRAQPSALSRERYRIHWQHVTHNAQYGISGLLLVSISIAATMLVSRMIIQRLGMEANGIFSVAWKVCSLYFGALYASASGYYFPLLSSTGNDEHLVENVNDAVSLYMYVLTPIAALLMIGGHGLMAMLFTSEFAGAATLLLVLLPGDLFRIMAETVGLSFLAKKKLKTYNGTYFLWAASFLGLSSVFLRKFGIAGVGYAYIASQILSSIVILGFARHHFHFTLKRTTLRSFVLGVCTLGAVSLLMTSSLHAKEIVCLSVILLWASASWRDEQFRSLVHAALTKTRKRFAP